MATTPQTTSAQLADGTTLVFQGQLDPEQVKQKVADYRANKASKIQKNPSGDTGVTDPSLPENQPPPGLLKRVGTGMNRGMDALLDMPGQVYHAFADAPKNQEEQNVLDAAKANPFRTGLGFHRLVTEPMAAEMSKGSQDFSSGSPVSGAGHTLAGLIPLIGPVAGQMGESIGKDPASGAGEGLMYLLAGEAMKPGAPKQPPLIESANRMLGDAATKTKQLVGQGGTVHQAVSKHFEQLTNDVAAADYADTAKTGKKIDTSSIWDAVTRHADDYAAGKTTPNFNAIADAIQKRPVEMTFKELHDLSKEVGSRWDKAKPGTRDAAAADSALADIRQKLNDRANEVGRGQQWDAAKTIWSTLKEYQGDGALNKLLNPVIDPAAPGAVTEGGKQFFDTLRDPANQPKLKEINKALEPYGMPADYFTDLAKSHAPLHNLVQTSISGGGMFGRTKAALRAAKENPAVAVPAVAAGTAAGSFLGPIGGTMGAIGGLSLAERLAAKNAIRKLGGVPPAVNPLAEASQVRPVGTGEKPPPPTTAPPAQQKPLSPKPAPVPTVNEDEVVSALSNLGYPRKTARSMAQAAIQDNPHDFNAALKQAVSGKGPQSVKADEIKSVSGGAPTVEEERGIKAPQKRQWMRHTEPEVQLYFKHRFDLLRDELQSVKGNPAAEADVQRRMNELDQLQRSPEGFKSAVGMVEDVPAPNVKAAKIKRAKK